MNYQDYFDFTFGRLGFAMDSTWELLNFEDGTRWFKIGFGFYWKKVI
jgi:hypothetical protein